MDLKDLTERLGKLHEKYTEKELEEHFGSHTIKNRISGKTVKKMFRGKTDIPAGILIAECKEHHIDIEDLLLGEHAPRAALRLKELECARLEGQLTEARQNLAKFEDGLKGALDECKEALGGRGLRASTIDNGAPARPGDSQKAQ